MRTVRVVSIGDDAAVTLSQDMLTKLDVHIGDEMRVVETAEGIELSALRDQTDIQLETATDVMLSDCELLKKLAE
jgi:hypothetical protein